MSENREQKELVHDQTMSSLSTSLDIGKGRSESSVVDKYTAITPYVMLVNISSYFHFAISKSFVDH